MNIHEKNLRSVVRKIILEADADEYEKELDKVFDAAEDSPILNSVEDEIEALIDDAIENPEEFAKSVNESIFYSKHRLNEGGAIVGLGIAAAAPVIMKGIAKLVNVIAKGLSAIDSVTGADENWREDGERWEQWWISKSEELHHAYIGTIEKIVKHIGRLPGVSISDDKVHKISQGIWTAIVAFLMIKSGSGIIGAIGAKSFGLAGLEGALTAIKAGEIGVYINDLFAIVA